MSQSYMCRMQPQQLKDWRRKRNWDQAQLAAHIGQSIHTVRAWEQGKNPIPPVVEKHLLSEVDLTIPLSLITKLTDVAAKMGRTFDDVLFESIKLGLPVVEKEFAPASGTNAPAAESRRSRGARKRSPEK